MRQLLVVLFLLSIVLSYNPTSYAQSATSSSSLNTPIITPPFAPTCGYAGVADKCCNIPGPFGKLDEWKKYPGVEFIQGLLQKLPIKDIQQQVAKSCYYGEPDTVGNSCVCVDKSADRTGKQTLTTSDEIRWVCTKFLSGTPEYDKCNRCALNEGGIYTAIGCVPTNLTTFLSNYVLSIGLGLAGLFSTMCLIFAAIQMQLSKGNPEKVKKSQELLTSCIMGLMLIIFSVFILRVIGVDILRIPGFLGSK